MDADDLYAQFEERSQFVRGPRCTLCSLISELPDDRAKALQRALETRSVTSAAISDVLRKWGQPVGDSSVRRHRRGGCMSGR